MSQPGGAGQARHSGSSDFGTGENTCGTLGRTGRHGTTDHSARGLIAYHEAGHAAIGHRQGLTFEVIYLGDASGQVIFDEQWEGEAVVRDPDLLDRYGLMLLAGGHAEQRSFGGVHGAQQDAETLERMLREARTRGTLPRPDLWRRAEQEVAEHWAWVEALADELAHRSTPVDDPAEVLVRYPHLGGGIAETSGARARAILEGLTVSG